MGMSVSAIKLYLELHQRGLLDGYRSVIEMGSQELHLKQADFEQLLLMSGISGYQGNDFAPWAWPSMPRCSSKPFFKLLGFSDYASIDLNQEHGSVGLDLNYPLEDRSLFCKYDLVTDHGCNEHAFNIAEAYRTMHRLCRSGGLIVIDQGVWHGNGYYLFDLSFFEGIAAANYYKVLFSGYVVSLKSTTQNGSNLQFHIPLSRDLLDAVDLTKVLSIGISYVFQKQSDADFKYPYQGSYLSHREGISGYALQFFPDPPARTYVPIAPSGSASHAISSVSALRRIARKIIHRTTHR